MNWGRVIIKYGCEEKQWWGMELHMYNSCSNQISTRTIATTEANLLDALETQIIFTSKDCKWLYYT